MPIDAFGHAGLTGINIHLAYAFEYANAAARTGSSGFVAGDVGKLARQLDDNSLWLLTAVTPTWAQVGGAGSGVDAINDLSDVVITTPSVGDILVYDGADWINDQISFVGLAAGLTVVLGNGEDVLAGTEPLWVVRIPFACTITGVYCDADASGDFVGTLGRAAAGSSTFSSIVASAPPTLSTAQTSTDETLTGWTTSLAAGDRLRFGVTSAATVKSVAVSLGLERT